MKIENIRRKLFGPIEKGIEGKKVESQIKGTFAGVDLKELPKYVVFEAAHKLEKSNLKLIIGILLSCLALLFITTRMEVSSLHKKLREKEYILAPGVLDFTTATPQAIPESYVRDAVTDFLSDLGNINSNNIDEQYKSLKRFMSDKLKVEFEIKTADWIDQVKEEGISQILTVVEKEIRTDRDGNYHSTVIARAEIYANRQYLGHENQVIEMDLKLVPPKKGKRWYLQISKLGWSKEESFRAKKSLLEQKQYKQRKEK